MEGKEVGAAAKGVPRGRRVVEKGEEEENGADAGWGGRGSACDKCG